MQDIAIKLDNVEFKKDTFMTLVETAKKLAVNTYRYFYDRISQQYLMPSLASLILSRSADNVIYNSA